MSCTLLEYLGNILREERNPIPSAHNSLKLDYTPFPELCTASCMCHHSEPGPFAGLVETSNNLAAVNPSEDGSSYTIIMSSRSSIGSALDGQRDIISQAAKLCNASCVQDNPYPG